MTTELKGNVADTAVSVGWVAWLFSHISHVNEILQFVLLVISIIGTLVAIRYHLKNTPK